MANYNIWGGAYHQTEKPVDKLFKKIFGGIWRIPFPARAAAKLELWRRVPLARVPGDKDDEGFWSDRVRD